MVELGHAFYAQSGANRGSWVHVDDLMKGYLKLVENRRRGRRRCGMGEGGKQPTSFASHDLQPLPLVVILIVLQGYYVVSSQEISQLDLARAAGRTLNAHGLIPTEGPKSLSFETVREMRGPAYPRGHPIRVRERMGRGRS